jgi:site-specific recombinase XerD
MLQKSSDSIKENFYQYLKNLGISAKSHKNYKSDITHFTGWLILKIRSFGSYIESLTEAVPFLDRDIAHEYRNFMLTNKIPVKTINRRLSTLRHLAKYLFSNEIIDSNFMGSVENVSQRPHLKSSIEPIIEEFRSYLVNEKVSQNTLKNYISDVRQFLIWIEANKKILNS